MTLGTYNLLGTVSLLCLALCNSLALGVCCFLCCCFLWCCFLWLFRCCCFPLRLLLLGLLRLLGVFGVIALLAHLALPGLLGLLGFVGLIGLSGLIGLIGLLNVLLLSTTLTLAWLGNFVGLGGPWQIVSISNISTALGAAPLDFSIGFRLPCSCSGTGSPMQQA